VIHRPPIPLLVILGPTASGKSRLGLEVAEALDGEIVSADAFAVYRGLDIGTDKPSHDDQRRVPHHLLDVADPRRRFSAGEFARSAGAAIAAIDGRGRTPIVVGGTHFWIRALLVGLFDAPRRDPAVSARLAKAWRRDPQALFLRLESVDPESARRIGPRDRQRVLRALEVFELTGEPLTDHWKRQQTQTLYDPLLVVPEHRRADLYARINARVERLFATGLVEEVAGLLASGVPADAHALKAIGYREVVDMLDGRCDLGTAVENTKRASRQFAKRQLTWLRGMREGTLHWVPQGERGSAATVIKLWTDHTKER
jgi:tRNA dimethylallyltransferase